MVVNRIYELSGSDSTVAFIRVYFPEGSTVTCTKGNTVLRTDRTDGYAIFRIPELGIWYVTAVNGTTSATKTVRPNVVGQSYPVTIEFRVPAAYQEVEYLQSTGTQYINTGLIFPADLSRRIEIKFRMLNDLTHSVGGTYQSANGNLSMLGFPGYVQSNGLFEILTSGAYAQSTASAGTDLTVVFNNSNHQVTENGTALLTLASGYYTCTLPFFLFGVNQDGSLAYSGSTRIYYFKYYSSDGTLLHEYIPCYRKSDNVPGFWDSVSETFKTNAGYGTFTVGPTV